MKHDVVILSQDFILKKCTVIVDSGEATECKMLREDEEFLFIYKGKKVYFNDCVFR